jgi:fluoride ion exporter CrcB/FEX
MTNHKAARRRDDKTDCWVESGVTNSSPTSTRTNEHQINAIREHSVASDPPTDQVPVYHVHKWEWLNVLYLSFFSIYGITIRSFLGRIFGGDCDATTPIDDWLTPFSSRICVTASGKTAQHGGALFIDLPANMFGCFIMGFLTGHHKDWPTLPWLEHDHPLQYDEGLHLGLKTALCGTITTLSSWNGQMVLMMDGTGTVLGSQVVAALFGYVIGLQISISSFRAGRTLASWCHLKANPHIFDVDLTPPDNDRDKSLRSHHHLIARVIPSIVASVLFVLYVLGDVHWNILYYRKLWIACLVGPLGTLMRWKFGTLNGELESNNWQWFPIGTFASNVIASVTACLINAIFTDMNSHEDWSLAYDILAAARLGFAGSLSTVSSMVKEVVEISEKNPYHDKRAFIYSYGTLVTCCLLGLLVYSPMVRFI